MPVREDSKDRDEGRMMTSRPIRQVTPIEKYPSEASSSKMQVPK